MSLGLHNQLTTYKRTGELWTPSEVSELKIWLDASDDSTLRAGITVGSSASTDGGAVGMWVNKVDSTKGIWGYGHWWSATRQTSAVNGKTVVRLADQNNFTIYGSNTREYPLSSPVSALTIAIVKKLPSTLVGSTEFSINYPTGPDAGYIGITTWNSKVHWHLGLPNSGTLNASPKSGTVTGGTTYLMIGRYEGSVSSALYMDGSLAESVSNPAASIAIATGSSIDQVSIGTGWGGHKGAVGDNCEILVWESALSTTDRQRLEGYLAHKWGIHSSLPLSHPYRFKPPLTTYKRTGELWTPSELTSLKAWYKADSISQADDTEVTTWLDSSGNGYHLTGYGTTKPKFRRNALNSLPIVRFNASGTLGRSTWSGYPTNNSAISVAAVVKRATSGTDCLFVSAGPIGNSRQDLIRVRNDNKFAVLRRAADSSFRYAESTTVSTGNLILLAGQNSSAQPFMNFNGNQETLNFGGAYTDLTLNDVTPTDITIGGFSDGTPLPNNNEVAEVVVCNINLSTTDRKKLEGYLAHKWGLTNNLPSDHPYKYEPPYK